LKIYFSGAIRGGRDDVNIYRQIIQHLEKFGTVLTAYIGDPNLDLINGEGRSDTFIWERDVRWVRESQVLVAEVTQPSLGVGYEIAIAHESHIPVLAFYQKESVSRISAMIAGDPNVHVCSYTRIENVLQEIDVFFKQLQSKRIIQE